MECLALQFLAGDLLTLMPFSNTLVVMEVTGLALLSALENGVLSDFMNSETRGGFPQVCAWIHLNICVLQLLWVTYGWLASR